MRFRDRRDGVFRFGEDTSGSKRREELRQRKGFEGANLEVSAKEIVGLVGPNGAGKTTLIKISLGLLSRDSRTVLLNGRDPFLDHKARERASAWSSRDLCCRDPSG